MTHIVGKVLYQKSLSENDVTLLLDVKRHSGVDDIIPVHVSRSILIPDCDYTGKYVYIKGRFCSENVDKHLLLYVRPDSIMLCSKGFHNSAVLQGTICKTPTYRLTPGGREISDVLIAVNNGSESSYIPCICWEDNALFSAQLNVGDKVRIYGRIQSRRYQKDNISKTAYELSADYIELD